MIQSYTGIKKIDEKITYHHSHNKLVNVRVPLNATRVGWESCSFVKGHASIFKYYHKYAFPYSDGIHNLYLMAYHENIRCKWNF